MIKVTQRTIVMNAIKQVLNVSEFNEKVTLTSSQKSQVLDIVAKDLIEHNCISDAKKDKYFDFASVRKSYANAVVVDCLRKVTTLTGGEKYIPKNPGSKKQAKDEVVATLKHKIEQYNLVLNKYADNATIVEKTIQLMTEASDQLEARLAQLNEKAIDLSCIDTELAELLSK